MSKKDELRRIEHNEEAEIFLELELIYGEQRQLRVQEHILRALIRSNVIARESLSVQQASMGYLAQIAGDLNPPPFPASFVVQETTMALQQPDPGATLQFTASPLPAGSSLGTVIPVWSSTDTANVTITPDTTGLVASVVLGAAIPVGEVVTLTVSATDPATGNLATGSATFTVGAPPATFPTSFGVTQTA